MSDQATNPTSTKEQNPDYALLQGKDDYTRYFNLLSRAFTMLRKLYRIDGSESSFEANLVYDYLSRLLYTAEALRMKYIHSPSHKRMLWLDLSDSGLPNSQDISLLSVDLLHKTERMRELPSAAMLKQQLLDHIFAHGQDSPELLWQLAERTYLQMLEEDKVFLSFMLDEENIRLQPNTKEGVRTYICAWGCYDFKTNRPYIHLMTFEQDPEATPLKARGPNHLKLLEIVQAEGSRVPDIGILAMAIDDALETIHPKILKRISLGPIFTPMLLSQEGVTLDEKHSAMFKLLSSYAGQDDFVLLLTHEIVFSKRQEFSRSIFAPNGRVREVFHLPEDDPESYARRASTVHKHALMPHGVAQHLDEGIKETVPELKDARIFTYDAKGAVYGS